jgi:hypothetical protein
MHLVRQQCGCSMRWGHGSTLTRRLIAAQCSIGCERWVTFRMRPASVTCSQVGCVPSIRNMCPVVSRRIRNRNRRGPAGGVGIWWDVVGPWIHWVHSSPSHRWARIQRAEQGGSSARPAQPHGLWEWRWSGRLRLIDCERSAALRRARAVRTPHPRARLRGSARPVPHDCGGGRGAAREDSPRRQRPAERPPTPPVRPLEAEPQALPRRGTRARACSERAMRERSGAPISLIWYRPLPTRPFSCIYSGGIHTPS